MPPFAYIAEEDSFVFDPLTLASYFCRTASFSASAGEEVLVVVLLMESLDTRGILLGFIVAGHLSDHLLVRLWG